MVKRELPTDKSNDPINGGKKKSVNWKNVGVSFLYTSIYTVFMLFITGIMSTIDEGIARACTIIANLTIAIILSVYASKLKTYKYKHVAPVWGIIIGMLFFQALAFWIVMYQFLQIKQGNAILKDTNEETTKEKVLSVKDIDIKKTVVPKSKKEQAIKILFGVGIFIVAISYGILNYNSNYENDRLKLAKEVLSKVLRVGMEEEGIKATNDMVDIVMATVKNKNKVECENSVIYYAFSVDSDTIWVKTEKSGDTISAEVMTDEIPQNCTLYEKIDNQWKKTEHIRNEKTQSPHSQNNQNNNVLYSSCDGMAVNLAVDTGCRYENDTIRMEIQSEKTTQIQSLYSQRFCVKGNVLTLLMGEEQSFDKNDTAFHRLPQVHPQNINCQKLINWLDNYGGMTMGIDDNEEPLYLGGRIG